MSFFNELKRRNVFKVAVAYIIVGWLILQVGEVLAPALRLPDWVNSTLAFFVILGFPLALIFAWAFEMTSEGLKLEKEVDRSESITHATGRKLDFTIIALLVVALGYFAFDKFVLDPRRDADLISANQQAAATNDESAEMPNERRSIAVLPFLNRSANEENTAFFSDGVHDEILTNLSKIGSLKVISRTSVMNYRDTTKSMPQIGAELGVATLLEGGVQRAGDNVRINVQLIDAAADEHIWADTYDRQLTAENIFTIQAEIATAIAAALHAALSPEEQARLSAFPTTSLAAYDLYLLATRQHDHQNWASLDQALVNIERAIELDPRFLEARVLKARIYDLMVNTGSRDLPDVEPQWSAAIDAALALDSASGMAQEARASYLHFMGDPGAAAAFELALRLEPRKVDIMLGYAGFLTRNSRPVEALELLHAARELDPLSINVLFRLGRVYSTLAETDKAIEAFARIRAIDPSTVLGKGPASGPYMNSGQMAESAYWLYQGWQADPRDSDLPNWIVRAYVDFEDLETANRWMRFIVSNFQPSGFSLASEAMLDVYAGRLDLAAEKSRKFLDRQYPERWASQTLVVRVLLMEAWANGDPGPALALIETARPDIFLPWPVITPDNLQQAIDTAHLLRMAGEEGRAGSLLVAVIEFARRPYALNETAKGSALAQALALLGEKQAAIEELQSKIDSGWRVLWTWETEKNPNFNSLRDEPQFLQIVNFLRHDMAGQLKEFRAMEAAGEIPALPGVDPGLIPASRTGGDP